MQGKTYIITSLSLVALIVYLFVTAPPPLPEHTELGMQLPTRLVLQLANEENKQARALYTREIVQAGKQRGLKFDEAWQEEKVIAGLLPAQFLRETATYLEKSPVRLGLYLGSDFPINKVNQLAGTQLQQFEKMKQGFQDSYFHLAEDQSYVFMSPDIAIAKACINCHNDHSQSPKQDWRLNDIMGATTWLYPSDTMSLTQTLEVLAELRNGFRFAYRYFLDEMSQLPNPPTVSDKWPKQGYFIPTEEHFMAQLTKRASDKTLKQLLQAIISTDERSQHVKDSH